MARKRVCRMCGLSPRAQQRARMYRVNETEVSFDAGRVKYWLCENCHSAVEVAIEAGRKQIESQRAKSIWSTSSNGATIDA